MLKAHSLNNSSRVWQLQDALWRTARIAVLGATVAILVGLIYRSDFTLLLLWNFLIPILPLSFFITTRFWRGVCPLATVNQFTGGRIRKTHLGGNPLTIANLLGIVLLIIMAPARRLIFNEHGPILAGTILIVIALAALLGSLYDVRAGFCNSICPVLPVERLYGHQPLAAFDNHRCRPCTHCVTKGCLEVDQHKSLLLALKSTDNHHPWLATAYGVFVAAFPGFIVGYFTCDNIDWTKPNAIPAAIMVYLWIAGCSLISYGMSAVSIYLLRLNVAVSTALLAAVAGALYYWWAAPLIAAELRLPPPATWGILAFTYAILAYWLVIALTRNRVHII